MSVSTKIKVYTRCSHRLSTDLICSEQNMKVLRVRFPLKLSPSLFVSLVTQHSQRGGKAVTT